MLPRRRGTRAHSPVGRTAVARPPCDAVGPRRQDPRGPGAGPLRCEPFPTAAPPPYPRARREATRSKRAHRHQPGPPRAVRIGYVPPSRTISAVAPMRSTATRTDHQPGRSHL